MISIHHSSYLGAEKSNINGIVSYNHETLSIGGYRNANIIFVSNVVDAENWFYNGVGRHIEVHSRLGNIVWEGVVNEVSFNVGGRKIKVGPLLKVSNNIRIGWQYPNYGIVGEPDSGKYEETDWKENEISQARYGVLDEFVSGGSSEYNPIIALQASLLDKLSEPGVSESISDGSDPTASVTLSCIGYSRLLEKQVYNNEWVSGQSLIDISQKLNTMLDENRFFVGGRTLTRDIQPIGIDVAPEDESNRTVWSIVTDHIAKSSIVDSIIFGVFAGITIVLSSNDGWRDYKRSSGKSQILDINNSKVENSEVLPGGTMLMVDFSKPVRYDITSVKYDLGSNSVSINFHSESLRTLLSETMLGGVFS